MTRPYRLAVSPVICTRIGIVAFLDLRFFDGTSVLAKDFWQSWIEGPRMFPSIFARPGQRVRDEPWTHLEQLGKSRSRIERTSFNCGE